MNRKIKRYGWIPDLPDHRDHLYAAPQPVLAKLPKKIDLRPKCPPVFNQGELGSCTANAIAAAHQFDQMKQSKPKAFTPSRLFIYYNEREIEGTVKEDTGAMIRDGIKSLVKQGAAPETTWPYVISKFATKPSKKCYDAGLKNQALSYQRLTPILSQLKGCLAAGYPFVFGFSVYESFESEAVARTGKVPMPDGSTEKQPVATPYSPWAMTKPRNDSSLEIPGEQAGPSMAIAPSPMPICSTRICAMTFGR